jgi:hypothetical protein
MYMNWGTEALQRMQARIAIFEHTSDQLMGLWCDHQCIGLGHGLQPRCQVCRLTNCGILLRDTPRTRSPTSRIREFIQSLNHRDPIVIARYYHAIERAIKAFGFPTTVLHRQLEY